MPGLESSCDSDTYYGIEDHLLHSLPESLTNTERLGVDWPSAKGVPFLLFLFLPNDLQFSPKSLSGPSSDLY